MASRPSTRTGVPGGPWKANSITAPGAHRSAKPSASPFRISWLRRARTSAGVAYDMRFFLHSDGSFNKRSLNKRRNKRASGQHPYNETMTTPRPTARAEQRRRTEARILDAATQAFFSAGYDRTTIRAVAAAAGVDAGLVMHYFGTKQELYRRVIEAAPVPEVSGTPAEAAEQILAGGASRLASGPAASPAPRADDADLRAAMITAIPLGITVSRHLIKTGELATADPAQVVALLRPCVLSLAARPERSGPAGEAGR